MNDARFNIDFKKLATQWLPTFLRNTILIAFVCVLVAPVSTLYVQFLKVRKQHLIKMLFNEQKFSLQKRLNDTFDKTERRIVILSALQYNALYLYTEAEDDSQHTKTKWLFGDSSPLYLRTEAEINVTDDFIVKIPNTGINLLQLKAEIEYYMLQSKNYRIEII